MALNVNNQGHWSPKWANWLIPMYSKILRVTQCCFCRLLSFRSSSLAVDRGSTSWGAMVRIILYSVATERRASIPTLLEQCVFCSCLALCQSHSTKQRRPNVLNSIRSAHKHGQPAHLPHRPHIPPLGDCCPCALLRGSGWQQGGRPVNRPALHWP